MQCIVPAILPQSGEDFEDKLARLEPIADARWVQIDAVDGRFAAPADWPYRPGDIFPQQLPHLHRFKYEIDLMTADPEREAIRWLAAGASRLAVHAESPLDLGRTLATIKKATGHGAGPKVFALGLAVSLATPLALIEPYLASIDYVQLMGIARIGTQRQPFDPRVLTKLRTLRASHPGLLVQIDGGVSRSSAKQLFALGASRLVVGHALMDASDLKAEYDALSVLGNA